MPRSAYSPSTARRSTSPSGRRPTCRNSPASSRRRASRPNKLRAGREACTSKLQGGQFMTQGNAADTVSRLAQAINSGDVDAAVALYEKDAVMVVQPGQSARGSAQLREALGGFIALKPTL